MATTQITRPLDELWEAWQTKFHEMKQDLKFADKITGPHITFKPDGYDSHRHTVLYVGKALGTQDTRDGEPPSAEELRNESRSFLQEVVSGKHPYAFWNLALDLSAQFASQGGPLLQNLIWSNICKIGAWNGKNANPEGDALAEQWGLAVETLCAEIEQYKPSLVMWVTHDYTVKSEQDVGVIGEVLNEPDPILWKRDLEKTDLWWRERTDLFPAMLWTGHPQGKPKTYLNAWIEKACNLVLKN